MEFPNKPLFWNMPGLLHLVFMQLVTRSGSSIVRLNGRESVLHPFIYKLQRELSEDCPQLHEMHFVTAGFPYSAELEEALAHCYRAGIFSWRSSEIIIHAKADTAEVLEEELGRVSRPDDWIRKMFFRLADAFEEIIIPDPPQSA